MKSTVFQDIDYHVSWAYSKISLEDMKKDIDKAIAEGITHIEIEVDSSYNDCSVSINFFKHRLETPAEIKKRLKQLDDDEKRRKENDLRLLKMLKEKYETNT
jgi:uncharacterized protein YggL (DUF469 family)